MNKRDFLKNLTLGSLALNPSLKLLEETMELYNILPPEQTASDEVFWQKVRTGYKLKPDYINLENGYYCFTPQNTLESFINHIREVNFQGSYYMRTKQFDNKKTIAVKLSELLGCGPNELIITRNTTESLDTIISGMDWKPDDEAVMAKQDYGAMLNQFKLMSNRFGMVNKIISVPNHPESDEEIVNLYESAITSKTRLLMVCHMINITGQILPVRKICDMAHSNGVKVLVDGAHALAHINFDIKDLDCDYYGASLHKWLSVPLGAGILYVMKENIENLWPLFAPWNDDINDIYKLNHTGTHPVYTDLAISDAIDYYNLIGADRKEARLRYLQNYWSDKLRNVEGIIINTPVDPKRSCGIANVGISRKKPAELAKILLEKYHIYTVAIDDVNVHGCRITPNIYTTPEELDLFVEAMLEINKTA